MQPAAIAAIAAAIAAAAAAAIAAITAAVGMGRIQLSQLGRHSAREASVQTQPTTRKAYSYKLHALAQNLNIIAGNGGVGRNTPRARMILYVRCHMHFSGIIVPSIILKF